MKTKIIFILIAFFVSNIYSQERGSDNKDNYYIDFSIPDNSAYTLLGISADKVTKPGSVKEIDFQLLNFLSSGTKILQGIAVEWNPYMSFYKEIENYSKNTILDRFTISVATAKNNVTNGTDVAFGIKIIPYDDANPYWNKNLRNSIENAIDIDKSYKSEEGNFMQEFSTFCKNILDIPRSYLTDSIIKFSTYNNLNSVDAKLIHIKCINRILKENKELSKEQSDQLYEKICMFCEIVRKRLNDSTDSEIDKSISNLKRNFQIRKWNATAFQLSGGIIATSDSSTWKTLQLKRCSFFTGYSHRIGVKGQAIFHLQYHHSWQNNQEFKDKFSAGSRFLYLFKEDSFHGSIEGLFSYLEKQDKKDINRRLQANLGIEYKMSDGLWLKMALGLDSPIDVIGKGSIVSLANIKYTFAKKSNYDKDKK